MSSHGMTPYIITRKAEPEDVEDNLVAAGHGDRGTLRVGMLKCASLSAFMAYTKDLVGTCLTRSA